MAGDAAHIVSSDTWKPGYSYDSDGQYTRTVQTDRSTEERSITRLEVRDTWAPGFQNAGDGRYVRLVSETRAPFAQSLSIAQRDTWAPGYMLDDMSGYIRVVPAQTAATPTAAE
jgi:hypothetical protein